MSQFTPAAVKPTVSVADVEKLDVRVGTIVSVDEVPNSSKLLRFTVDFGDHTRTILAGMKAERSQPQEIVGLQALFVVNLEPKRMAGQVSQACCSTSGSLTGSSQSWPCPSTRFPTESGLANLGGVTLLVLVVLAAGVSANDTRTISLRYDPALAKGDFPNPAAQLTVNGESAWFLFDTGVAKGRWRSIPEQA